MDRYNWDTVPREQMGPLVVRQLIHTPDLTLLRGTFQQGAVVATHQHEHEQVTTVQSPAASASRSTANPPSSPPASAPASPPTSPTPAKPSKTASSSTSSPPPAPTGNKGVPHHRSSS